MQSKWFNTTIFTGLCQAWTRYSRGGILQIMLLWSSSIWIIGWKDLLHRGLSRTNDHCLLYLPFAKISNATISICFFLWCGFFLQREGPEQQEFFAAPCKEESHEQQFLFETDLDQIVELAACNFSRSFGWASLLHRRESRTTFFANDLEHHDEPASCEEGIIHSTPSPWNWLSRLLWYEDQRHFGRRAGAAT